MTDDERALTKAIGERLRAQRLMRDWSLSELARRTGGVLAKSRISNYEQGLRRLGLEEANLLANALEMVSPAYLLHLEDYKGPLSRDEFELIEA
ncbi:MAG: XRE family transcriptional regulator, partial [Sphingobacteriia bacterium]|nr:XRE family transcriptional regulator [Sphingobacteriia bacterium]